MAAVFTPVRQEVVGTKKHVTFKMACDTSYPTGGYPLAAADVQALGLSEVLDVELEAELTNIGGPTGYIAGWNGITRKITVHRGDNPNAAVAPLVEVTNAFSLNGQSVLGRAIGY